MLNNFIITRTYCLLIILNKKILSVVAFAEKSQWEEIYLSSNTNNIRRNIYQDIFNIKYDIEKITIITEEKQTIKNKKGPPCLLSCFPFFLRNKIAPFKNTEERFLCFLAGVSV